MKLYKLLKKRRCLTHRCYEKDIRKIRESGSLRYTLCKLISKLIMKTGLDNFCGYICQQGEKLGVKTLIMRQYMKN